MDKIKNLENNFEEPREMEEDKEKEEKKERMMWRRGIAR